MEKTDRAPKGRLFWQPSAEWKTGPSICYLSVIFLFVDRLLQRVSFQRLSCIVKRPPNSVLVLFLISSIFIEENTQMNHLFKNVVQF